MRKLSILVVLLMLATTIIGCGPQDTGQGAQATATSVTAVETPEGEPTTEPTETTAAVESPTTGMAETPTVAASGTTTTTTAGETPTVVPVDAGEAMQRIKQRGKLIVGVKFDQPLFGLLNQDTGQPEGFDVDMARAVANRIFGDPNAIQFEESISRNRIPYLNEERVDIVFATMTANAERAKQILFSDCYYVAGQSLLVAADSTITGLKDLDGKTVGTVKGSTSEKNIRAAAPNATVELFDGYAAAVQAMDAGRVEAVTTDDIILYGFQSQNPEKYKVVGGQFTSEPYAAGLKLGNTLLQAEVNATIREMKENGEWAALYKKWIGQDAPAIPPQNWQDVTAGGTGGTGSTPVSSTPAPTGTP